MPLIEDISSIVSEQGLLLGEDVAARKIAFRSCKAKAIVRPASTEELSKVMQLCHAAGQNVVPHGGLTGLVGGAQCSENDIAISLERMRSINARKDHKQGLRCVDYSTAAEVLVTNGFDTFAMVPQSGSHVSCVSGVLD